MTTLVWFQRDLRIHANQALKHALELGEPIVAVYIHSPDEESPWNPGAASCWWLHHSLATLRDNLKSIGIELQFFNTNSVQLLPQLASDYAARHVIWTNRHEPARRTCEDTIAAQLISSDIAIVRYTDELLSKPDHFVTASKQTPYRVFTPFYKRLRRELCFDAVATSLKRDSAKLPFRHKQSRELEQLKLLGEVAWHDKLHAYWTPGENAALDQIDRLTSLHLQNYTVARDVPSLESTSRLSPYLHFGEISPRQVMTALSPLLHEASGGLDKQAESLLRQLIWREFARYILRHFPETANHSMNQRYSDDFWTPDAHALSQWQRGATGIPIIDAGMHQLWETGWMHNRVRMLVASLLTKNLGVHWLDGARWFWDTLVDADLANNSMGWQWVAGSGVDASPYFRIFNPLTQTKRFDPQNRYIDQWNSKPQETPAQTPITDLASSREQAIARYNQFIRIRRESQ